MSTTNKNAPSYLRRLTENSESQLHADRNGEEWTEEDVAFLMEFWDGTHAAQKEIAEALGRTLIAVQVKHSYIKNGYQSSRPFKNPAHQSGWMIGFCTKCGYHTDVWCNGTNVRLCEDCRG